MFPGIKSLPWHACLGNAVALLLLLCNSALLADDAADTHAVRNELHALLENAVVAGAGPEESALIENFYWTRGDAPAWLNSKRLWEFDRLDELARSHGLDAADYRFTDLAKRIHRALDADSTVELATLELLAARRIARLAGHLRLGKVDPAGRRATPRSGGGAMTGDLLALAAMSESLVAFLDSLPPDTFLYRKLQWSLAWHRALLEQGTEWLSIPAGEVLEPGKADPRVPLLRARLGLPARADSLVYDAEITAAVAAFQARHLLDSDGLLGRQTIDEMNTSIEKRIDQLRVNLDWQRWASLLERDEHIVVNVAHYQMHWMHGDERVWSTRTQVGKPRRPTPVFKSSVSAIMVNPAWTVPPTIFRNDVLPKLKADPAYLQRERMTVVDRAGHRVDSDAIDWQQTSAKDFPYRLRARPGKGNALGRMKFLMPNPYLIYLHDTPSKHLFDKDARAYSSGCVRIEHPEKLARFLIDRQRGVSRERLDAALAGRKTRYLGMDRTIPVTVMYATVDLDANRELVFARDVYGKDARALAVLNSVSEPGENPIRLAHAGL